MLFLANHSAKRRRFLRALITHAMAFVFLFSLLVPHPAPAVTGLDVSSPAFMASTKGAGTQPGEPAEYDVVKHASCACHIFVPAQSLSATLVCVDFDAAYIARGDTQPRPGPASLPFKPPRA